MSNAREEARQALSLAIADAEIQGNGTNVERIRHKWDRVAIHMRDMEHDLAAYKRPDRALIAQLAGNIAGGLMANTTLTTTQIDASFDTMIEGLAGVAVQMARAIMVEVDKAGQ